MTDTAADALTGNAPPPRLPARRATFPGLPASVPAARRFVSGFLVGCPRADDLAQAVTELAVRERTLLPFGRWSSPGR
jgi:hypothetical protein